MLKVISDNFIGEKEIEILNAKNELVKFRIVVKEHSIELRYLGRNNAMKIW